jgi:hypothetical protein
VDKNLLLDIARRYGTDSVQQAEELLALRSQFPFSQLLHVLSAKLSKDLNLPSQQTDLQDAAVYSTDRSLLKDIMLEPFVTNPAVENLETTLDSYRSNNDEKIEADSTYTPPPVSVTETDIDKTVGKFDVADTVMNDLKKLNEARHNFEMLFADATTVSVPVATSSPSMSTEQVAKIEALASEIAPRETPIPPSKKRKKEPHVDHNILDEIKKSKEEIELETERQKQQIEIIDQFIKAQPSITQNPPKEKPAGVPPTDLNSIKSGEFSDNIISETLVEILLKQGKTDRAIEVLKKLIWKYPQKKAYFASRIEDLKK